MGELRRTSTATSKISSRHRANQFLLRAASLIVQSAQDIAAGKEWLSWTNFVLNTDFSQRLLVIAPQEKPLIVAEDAGLEYQNSRDGNRSGEDGWSGGREANFNSGPCFADFTPASPATEAHRGVPTEGGGSRPASKSASW